jgi:hypothetical protein
MSLFLGCHPGLALGPSSRAKGAACLCVFGAKAGLVLGPSSRAKGVVCLSVCLEPSRGWLWGLGAGPKELLVCVDEAFWGVLVADCRLDR